MASILKVGTRGSRLARIQTEKVINALEQIGFKAEVKIIKTRGDVNQRVPLFGMGQRGIFVKELERALLEGEIDVAVHSAKDIPTEMDPHFGIPAVLPRGSAYDLLVSPYETITDIPSEAHIGTSSLRRAAMLMYIRPDLNWRPIRGNVDTRLKKVLKGDVDGVILARAGVERLGYLSPDPESVGMVVKIPESPRVLKAYELRPPSFVPSAAQGILAVEMMRNHPNYDAVSRLNHLPTWRAMAIERRILSSIGAGCLAPVGVYAEAMDEQGQHFRVHVSALTTGGTNCFTLVKTGSYDDLAIQTVDTMFQSDDFLAIRETWKHATH